jgi:hypothetical protein
MPTRIARGTGGLVSMIEEGGRLQGGRKESLLRFNDAVEGE